MKKWFLPVMAVLTFSAFADDVSLDSSVLSTDGNTPSYIEFSGTYAAGQATSADLIRAIGANLGKEITLKQKDASPLAEGNPKFKYSAARIYGSEKPGADILYLGKSAGVDTIKCLRMIVSGYIREAFGSSAEESDIIAAAVCDWNARNYGNTSYFKSRFDEKILDPFSDLCTDAGLPSDYKEWPNSRIVIPHQAAGSATVSAVSAVAAAAETIFEQEEDPEPALEEEEEIPAAEGPSISAVESPRSLIAGEEADIMREPSAVNEDNGWPWWWIILLIILLLIILLIVLICLFKKRAAKNTGKEVERQVNGTGPEITVYDGSGEETKLLERIKEENPDVDIKLDGSLPFYYRQGMKILMIGKDNNGIDGSEYSEAMVKAYKAHRIASKNGFMTPSAHIIHRRTLKYVWGLQKDLDYKDIPKANDLADIVGDENGFSFARINVIKNAEVGSSYADGEKLIQEQIRILKPDLAIGMKLDWEALDKLGTPKEIDSEGNTKLYDMIDDSGWKYKLINAGIYFSDPKGGDEILYEEIRRLFKKL
ncbi:MAG TPA: hypothetical protein DCM57_02670 [Treponema sp.]|nr:hypothetical protein [Treponema sp.]